MKIKHLLLASALAVTFAMTAISAAPASPLTSTPVAQAKTATPAAVQATTSNKQATASLRQNEGVNDNATEIACTAAKLSAKSQESVALPTAKAAQGRGSEVALINGAGGLSPGTITHNTNANSVFLATVIRGPSFGASTFGGVYSTTNFNC